MSHIEQNETITDFENESRFSYGKLPNIIQTILDTGKPPAVTHTERVIDSMATTPISNASVSSYSPIVDIDPMLKADVPNCNMDFLDPFDQREYDDSKNTDVIDDGSMNSQHQTIINGSMCSQHQSIINKEPTVSSTDGLNRKVKMCQEMDESVTGMIRELAHNDTISQGQRIALLTKYVTMCQSILEERFGVKI